MQVLKVGSEITVLYKIIITKFFKNHQNTPSFFLAPLYIALCFFDIKHHSLFVQHLENPKSGRGAGPVLRKPRPPS